MISSTLTTVDAAATSTQSCVAIASRGCNLMAGSSVIRARSSLSRDRGGMQEVRNLGMGASSRVPVDVRASSAPIAR
jgi:hypothetical protein